MADLKQDFGISAPLSIIGLDGLASEASATSAAVDLGDPGPFDIDLEIVLSGASASNTGICEIYLKRSIDNTDFDDDGNDQPLGAIRMNGAATVARVIRIADMPRYFKIRIKNASGGGLAASGNVLTYVPVHVSAA